MKIGVFDTGTGGKLVAKRLEKLMPQHLYITAIDREHAPYGNRSPEEIITLTDAAIQPLLSCSIIILACNTATTIAIQPLRQRYPDVRFIGFEPRLNQLQHSLNHVISLYWRQTPPNTASVCARLSVNMLLAFASTRQTPVRGRR